MSAPKPPLTTMPSTPGPELPGGYPRDSVVFAGNKWEEVQRKRRDGAGSYFPPGLDAKSLLPGAVASYFPSGRTAQGSSSAPSTPGPYPYSYPLNTDGSVASNFSTRAFAGSSMRGSGSTTPVPSESGFAQESEAAPELVQQPQPQQQTVPTSVAVADAIPAVAPLAGISAFAHGNSPAQSQPQDSITPPVPATKTSPRARVRFGGHRKAASESTPSPPSAFTPTTAPASSGTDDKPKRSTSLLRTLRGEAKVLAGKVRRDPGKVEEGRRMVRGQALAV
ncbi:hypothetical protein MKEN_01303900 [Mycena kentingensis (nom. inval.)]|nr:hypothetical protein MKEN_01303900 [Mycena kentingensis (nom. inval.)]